jgi:hypothetical protein
VGSRPVRFTKKDRPHEWVSFEDPDEQRTWVFDVTFLLSSWRCIFGQGCQGVLTGPTIEKEQGCCSYGAHFTDEEDRARVETAAGKLTADQWQWQAEAAETGIVHTDESGNLVTVLAEDACIFLNRPGFEGGAGCALHRAALEAGERPLDWKPNVCWQLPLRRLDDEDGTGHVTSTVRQWERRDWGEGGAEFHWWCTEAAEAFTGGEPVYRSMADELTALTTPAAAGKLVAYLEGRAASASALAHPAQRPAPAQRRSTAKAGQSPSAVVRKS